MFVDDRGKLFNITNQAQEKVRPMAGKHCMIKAKKDPASDELDIQNMPELIREELRGWHTIAVTLRRAA